MANTVPPPTFQIIGAILVFIGALTALGTLAADHAYWQQLIHGSGKPRLPTNWLMIPMGERIVSPSQAGRPMRRAASPACRPMVACNRGAPGRGFPLFRLRAADCGGMNGRDHH